MKYIIIFSKLCFCQVGCIKFKKPRANSAPVRRVHMRPSSARPNTKLGTWEDTLKPDTENVHELNVCGRSTDTGINQLSYLYLFYIRKSS